MAIGKYAVVKIQEEGIEDMDDLEMFDKNFLKHLTDNLRFPGSQIEFGGAIVVTPAFKFGTKSQMRLEAASNIV